MAWQAPLKTAGAGRLNESESILLRMKLDLEASENEADLSSGQDVLNIGRTWILHKVISRAIT